MPNVERSGKRNFMALSSITREVFGIRSQDIDMVTYCPSCKHPVLLMEATSSQGPKYTQVLRIIGSLCGIPVLMIRHSWEDTNHEHPIDMYLWHPGSTSRDAAPDQVLEETSWSSLKSAMLNIHERHKCT